MLRITPNGGKGVVHMDGCLGLTCLAYQLTSRIRYLTTAAAGGLVSCTYVWAKLLTGPGTVTGNDQLLS